ncbi:hypothetical protein SASPL_151404 [Salvia splendens]|uniref:Uncharacterized protein n=1 Tax=Salvia splendens TaxID=180675 RepID=A0A8X8W8S4_SALSN|nr:hypothetical protein SASPL_151404 [Salvia splendens]
MDSSSMVGPRPRRHAPALRAAQLHHLPVVLRPPLPRRAPPLPRRPRRDPGGAVEPQRRGDADALEVGELVDVREPTHELRGCRLGVSMGELAEEVLGIYGMGKE